MRNKRTNNQTKGGEVMADTLKCGCGGEIFSKSIGKDKPNMPICEKCFKVFFATEMILRTEKAEAEVTRLTAELEAVNKRVDVVNPNDIVLIINQKLNEDLSFQGIVDVNETAIEIAEAIQSKLKAR
jgi:hypothetical protein